MDDKKAREAFRVQQFGSPHPALQVAAAAEASLASAEKVQPSATAAAAVAAAAGSVDAADPLHINLVPDHERVIIHFDVDCFYAQVEECRNPALRGKPLAVTQKYLVVTANYPAREAGVTKLMGIADAKKACPHLLLVPGEDLTPYRAASRVIRTVLSRWGPTEKLGLDESWVDVTQEVDRRLAAAAAANTTAAIISSPWSGHLVNSSLQLTSHSRHRPMDLRVVRQQQQEHEHEHESGNGGEDGASIPPWLAGCEARLKIGAVVAAEMRAAVKAEAAFRCSAGISCSKLLSKLVSGLHKPDDQTIILPTQAQAFVAPLPVRALPGVGYKADGLLKSWGVATAAEARAISKQQLIQALGDKPGAGLFHACRGVDPTPVVASGPPKSITVEDSFKACSTWQGVAQVLQVLVPDLLDRLVEDAEEFPQLSRTPSTLTVKWRKAGTGWTRSSASTPWPPAAKMATTNTSSSGSHSAHGPLGAGQHPTSISLAFAAAGIPSPPAAAAAGRGGEVGLCNVVGASHQAATATAVAAVTAAATSLLKQHLPASGFSLTLLNVGVGFKGKPPSAGVGGSIQNFFAPKQLVQPSLPAATAPLGAPAGAASVPSPPAVAAGGGGGGRGMQGMDLLQQAKAATEARRDYNRVTNSSSSSSALLSQPRMSCMPHCVPHAASELMSSPVQAVKGAWGGGQQGMLTKRQERQLWELAMQQQQQQQQEGKRHAGPHFSAAQGGAAGAHAVQQLQQQQLQQQPPQQQQHQKRHQQYQHQQHQQASGLARQAGQAVAGALSALSTATSTPVSHSTPSAPHTSQLWQQQAPGSTLHGLGPTPDHTPANVPFPKRQCLSSRSSSSPDTAVAAAAQQLDTPGEKTAGGATAAAAAAAATRTAAAAAAAAAAVQQQVPACQGGDRAEHAAAAFGVDAVTGDPSPDAAAAAVADSLDGLDAAAGWSGGGSWCCTTLHSVDGLGVLACEVIEEFEGDSE